MSTKKLKLYPKNTGSQERYHTFSIRTSKHLFDQISSIATQTGRSRNEIVQLMLEYSLTIYTDKNT